MKRKNVILEFLLTGTIGFIVGGAVIWSIFGEVIKKDNHTLKKITGYYHLLNQWVALKQKKKTVADFFRQNNYKTVAIYGMKELGERLLDELEDTEIVVKCIIDQDAIAIDKSIQVLHPDDTIPDVDVIVVTASYYFGEIVRKMEGKIYNDIVSIDDVVYSEY